MTTHLDLQETITPAGDASTATLQHRGRHWMLPVGLVAVASVTAIVGAVAMHDDSSVERVRPMPMAAEVVATNMAVGPAGESSIIRAERSWAGDEFDLVPVRGHTMAESSIVRAERSWAGDEFDLAPVTGGLTVAESSIIRAERALAGNEFGLVAATDICPMHNPC